MHSNSLTGDPNSADDASKRKSVRNSAGSKMKIGRPQQLMFPKPDASMEISIACSKPATPKPQTPWLSALSHILEELTKDEGIYIDDQLDMPLAASSGEDSINHPHLPRPTHQSAETRSHLKLILDANFIKRVSLDLPNQNVVKLDSERTKLREASKKEVME